MSISFFKKINYSACNEDSESERKALCLTTEDTALCITGSGSRALDLLIDSPKKIISVDFNATQNYLLELKIAAYKSLNYSEFRSFIGLDESAERPIFYNKLSLHLTSGAKKYWDEHFVLIQNGVLYCGTWELLLRKMLKWAFLRRKKMKTLMESATLEIQKKYWKTHWNDGLWQFFLKLICNKFLWTKIVREPGALLIPRKFDVYVYMNDRLNFLANNHLLRTNHFANLLFCGAYRTDCILPIHLQEEHFNTIKNQVHKIEMITDSLLNILENNQIINQVSAFSLSDFSSYSNVTTYNEIWNRITMNSKPGTKFCERHFLVKRNPEKENQSIIRNYELEIKLSDEDCTALYTFCAGGILGIRNQVSYIHKSKKKLIPDT